MAGKCTLSALLIVLLSTQFLPSCSFMPITPRKVSGWVNRPPANVVSHQAPSDESDQDPDLFEYFDPLLSPHAYPNGISPDPKPIKDEEEEKNMNKDNYNPLEISGGFGFEQEFNQVVEEPVPNTDAFDPTLSPHMYPNGTPSTLVGDETSETKASVVGILLMDHGSRNQASNDRLHELARAYQATVGSNIVVRAAHMELASPSIPDGLENLLKSGVDEIVCHPYFLSPHGRHVSQDIPRIVKESVESLNIEIPIVTTDPVGAHTDLMISAIQTVVQTSSATLRQSAGLKS